MPARIIMPLTDAFGGHGGIALYNRDVLNALSDSAAVERIVALPRIAAPFDDPLPAKVDWRGAAAGGTAAYLAASLRAALADRPCDLIWCAHVNLLPLARAMKAATGARLVLAIYGTEAWQPFARRSSIRALSHVDHVLSISAVTRDRFTAWSHYPAARTTIVANAIDLSLYGERPRDAALAERLDLAGREVVLIFGRMHPTERLKGFDELLEATPGLVAARPNAVVVLAGDGDDRPRLEKKARALGIADHVRFTGRVAEAEKAALYGLADAYVMPSRQEGFGFVHLEAMASGTPAVASNADGAREAVREGAIGRLIEPTDQASIVRETIAALDTPRGIPAGLAHFAYPRFAAEVDAMIRRVVA